MKKILFLLTICTCISSCNNGDIERLEKENESLKTQIAEIRQNQQNQIENSPIKTTPQTNTDTIAKTKAQQIVKNYVLAGTIKERIAFVANPKEELPRMNKTYEDINLSWENGSFEFGEDRKLDNYVLVTVLGNQPSTYVVYALKQEGKELKIDWSTSQLLNGYSPLLDNTKKMKLDMDSKIHHLLVIIEASTYYPVLNFFSEKQQIYYSFTMDDHSKEHEKSSGFCAKNKVSCQNLFEKLKEKNKCVVSLDAWYPQGALEAPYSMSKTMQMEIDNVQIKFCW